MCVMEVEIEKFNLQSVEIEVPDSTDIWGLPGRLG